MKQAPKPLPTPGIVWGPYPERTRKEISASFLRRLMRLGRRIRAWVILTLSPVFGSADNRFAHRVFALANRLSTLSNTAIDQRLCAQRTLLARDGLTDAHVATTLSLVAEVSRRSIGQAPYRTQLIACRVLLSNRLAEMATGEGKTLATGLAAAVGALAGMPVHVLTANSYLVQRDHEMLKPLYDRLGLTSASVLPGQDSNTRRACYRCQVLYATASELVFDYLRDRLELGMENVEAQWHIDRLSMNDDGASNRLLMRGLCMAIVDEADSVLLDEACTPLVLSQASASSGVHQEYIACFAAANKLWMNRDFLLRTSYRRAQLTPRGRHCVEQASIAANIPPRKMRALVETALAAKHLYQLDRDYLIVDAKIIIVDATTGRTAHGRVWSGGLQQMIEHKHQLPLTVRPKTMAQITYQQFFPRYLRLSGLSGSLREAHGEFAAIYNLGMRVIPLRQPCQRQHRRTKVFAREIDKWRAVTQSAHAAYQRGQPVLIGVESVRQAQVVSTMLGKAGLAHHVLSAANDDLEAQIVANAGQPGVITVATNMAGRGTDIGLHATVAGGAGLLLIACHYNDERRTDRQLAGRVGRRGQPGQVQRFASLQDAICGPAITRLGAIYKNSTGHPFGMIVSVGIRALFAVSQRFSEFRKQRTRTQILEAGISREQALPSFGTNE